MRFLDYIAILRQRMVVLLAVAITVALAVSVVTLLQPPVYVARVKMKVLPPAPGNDVSNVLRDATNQFQNDLFTEGEILKSSEVAQRVVTNLNLAELDTPAEVDELIDRITVLPVRQTAIMVVEARAADPDLARNLANNFTAEYLNKRREDARNRLTSIQVEEGANVIALGNRLREIDAVLATQVPGSAEELQTRLQREQVLAQQLAAQANLQSAGDVNAIDRGFGEILIQANKAEAERAQSFLRGLLFGLGVGTVLAIAVALALDSLSDTVRTKDDVEVQTETEVLGIVPFDDTWDDPDEDRLASEIDPFGSVAEYYRTLRHNLARAVTKSGARTILITSPTEGDGKSVTAANLSMAYVDTGHRVVLVEADLRRPRVYRFLGARPDPGFADVLEGRVSLVNAAQRVRPGLTFLAAGTPSERPDQTITQSDLGRTFADLVAVADRATRRERRPALVRAPSVEDEAVPVLLDGAPVLQAAEVSTLAAEVDGVVLVLRAGVTSRAAAAEAAEQIRRAGGRLLGAVLVGATGASDVPARRTYLPKFITDLRDQIAGLRAG